MYDSDNIFWQIITGKMPAKKIYEDEILIAIEDKYPQAPVHALIIPKGQYIDYQDFISKALGQDIVHFFKKINEIAVILNIQDNFQLITNKGAEAGQVIFHFHVHLKGKFDKI